MSQRTRIVLGPQRFIRCAGVPRALANRFAVRFGAGTASSTINQNDDAPAAERTAFATKVRNARRLVEMGGFDDANVSALVDRAVNTNVALSPARQFDDVMASLPRCDRSEVVSRFFSDESRAVLLAKLHDRLAAAMTRPVAEADTISLAGAAGGAPAGLPYDEFVSRLLPELVPCSATDGYATTAKNYPVAVRMALRVAALLRDGTLCQRLLEGVHAAGRARRGDYHAAIDALATSRDSTWAGIVAQGVATAAAAPQDSAIRALHVFELMTAAGIPPVANTVTALANAGVDVSLLSDLSRHIDGKSHEDGGASLAAVRAAVAMARQRHHASWTESDVIACTATYRRAVDSVRRHPQALLDTTRLLGGVTLPSPAGWWSTRLVWKASMEPEQQRDTSAARHVPAIADTTDALAAMVRAASHEAIAADAAPDADRRSPGGIAAAAADDWMEPAIRTIDALTATRGSFRLTPSARNLCIAAALWHRSSGVTEPEADPVRELFPVVPSPEEIAYVHHLVATAGKYGQPVDATTTDLLLCAAAATVASAPSDLLGGILADALLQCQQMSEGATRVAGPLGLWALTVACCSGAPFDASAALWEALASHPGNRRAPATVRLIPVGAGWALEDSQGRSVSDHGPVALLSLSHSRQLLSSAVNPSIDQLQIAALESIARGLGAGGIVAVPHAAWYCAVASKTDADVEALISKLPMVRLCTPVGSRPALVQGGLFIKTADGPWRRDALPATDAAAASSVQRLMDPRPLRSQLITAELRPWQLPSAFQAAFI